MSIMMLSASAAGIAAVHTLAGPDHYLPFIALGKAQAWSVRRTVLITVLCGFGHVLSSIVLGFLVAYALTTMSGILPIEDMRGKLASYGLFGFGLLYTFYALWGLAVNRHKHSHNPRGLALTSFWWLFIIFAFGPCEPLIPLIVTPAIKGSFLGMGIVSGVFTVVTLGVMVAVVLLSLYGLKRIQSETLHKYAHLAAGLVLTFSGAGMAWLGL